MPQPGPSAVRTENMHARKTACLCALLQCCEVSVMWIARHAQNVHEKPKIHAANRTRRSSNRWRIAAMAHARVRDLNTRGRCRRAPPGALHRSLPSRRPSHRSPTSDTCSPFASTTVRSRCHRSRLMSRRCQHYSLRRCVASCVLCPQQACAMLLFHCPSAS